jgi:hypothetical protein
VLLWTHHPHKNSSEQKVKLKINLEITILNILPATQLYWIFSQILVPGDEQIWALAWIAHFWALVNEYSPSYGPISRAEVVRAQDKRSRGFAYVDFVNPDSAAMLVSAGHVMFDGRNVEIKINTIKKGQLGGAGRAGGEGRGGWGEGNHRNSINMILLDKFNFN